MQLSLNAFQFDNRLQPSLLPVVESFKRLSGLVANPERIYYPKQWMRVCEHIRSRVSMASEIVMCNVILYGKSIE
jgi:hypothetical protein